FPCRARLLCPTRYSPLPNDTERAPAPHLPHCLPHTNPVPFSLCSSSFTPRASPPLCLPPESSSPGELSRHRSPPPDPLHLKHPLDVTRRPRALPGETNATPSLADVFLLHADDPTAERLLPDVRADGPLLRK